MDTIKRIDENTKSFTGASGTVYRVHPTLTADAFQVLEELRIEIEGGNTAGDLLKLVGEATAALQKSDVYTAAVKLYNATNIAERINRGGRPAWLLALTLFVRPEGADLTKWDEAEADGWIQDWNEAGLAIDDLFTLAFACRVSLDLGFMRNFRDTSDQPQPAESGSEKGTKAQESQ